MNINDTFGSLHPVTAAVLHEYINLGVINFFKHEIETLFQVKLKEFYKICWSVLSLFCFVIKLPFFFLRI
jgi:hypothetical protein